MVKKEVNLFSKDSISDTQNMLSKLSDYLSSKELIAELTEQAYEEVMKNVSKYSQEHLYNIQTEVSETEGKVYTDDKVLIYLEYGTGKVGADNPHPALDGWEYMSKKGKDYSKGWTYKNEETGESGWTMGLPAGKGFYNARENMKDIAGDKVKLTIEKIFNYKK